MSRRIFVWLFSTFAFFVMASGSMRDARAQNRAAANDREVESLIESVITSDYVTGNFTQALEQLELAKQACQTQSGCSPKVRARLYIAIGTVLAGGLKKVPEAKEAFAVALKEDPTTGLFGDDFITPEVQKAFNDARAGDTASGGTEDTQGRAGERKPKKTWPGTGRPPRGWKSAESYFYYEEARISEASRDWLDCVDYAQASLAAENRATTRLLAAACEERAQLWLEAYADYRTVGENGGKNGNPAARERAQALREKIPKIVIRKPANAENVVVKLNDVALAQDKLGVEIWLNPGQRTLKATGKVNGENLEFVKTIEAAEFEPPQTIDIKFVQREGTDAKKKTLECLLAARTQEELSKCVPFGTKAPALTVKAGMELAGYHDSDHVDVISPQWTFGIESPTSGWGLGGSFAIDVVTAASTDIVATASPRWREVRVEPSIYAHRKFGSIGDIGIHANTSYSPDDWGKDVGLSYSVDVANKRITPSISYDFGHEDTGRSGTPYQRFDHQTITNSVGASLSFVLDKSTIFALTFTGIFQNGDTSKPYRYIPMFDAATLKNPTAAAALGNGALISNVQLYRLPIRPLDQLPLTLQRYALSGLIAHRFSSSTVRADVRGYTDSWGLKAVTGSLAYYIDLNERFRIWPLVHGHYQTGAAFWQRTYTAAVKVTNNQRTISLPQYRSGDRELGPLVGATGSLAARLALGEERNWSITLQGSAIYNQYFDTLYLASRLGYLGVSTLEVDFE